MTAGATPAERNTRIMFFRLGDITIEISGGGQQTEEGIGKPDRLWGLAWGVGNLTATVARLRAANVMLAGSSHGGGGQPSSSRTAWA